MTNEEMFRRIRAGEDVEHVFDIKNAEERESFRAFLANGDERSQLALRHYDAAMKELDSGRMGARSTWHSISSAQKRALDRSQSGRIKLDGSQYMIHHFPFGYGPIGRKPTIRNLCSRDLLAWDGGAFNPEAAAVITERGRFVLQFGPTEPPKRV